MRSPSRQVLIAVVVAITAGLAMLMFGDNSSPLYTGMILPYPVHAVLNVLLAPAALVALYPVLGAFLLYCPTSVARPECAGLLDGGPLDPLLFSIHGVFVGVVYGLLVYLLLRVWQRRRSETVVKSTKNR